VTELNTCSPAPLSYSLCVDDDDDDAFVRVYVSVRCLPCVCMYCHTAHKYRMQTRACTQRYMLDAHMRTLSYSLNSIVAGRDCRRSVGEEKEEVPACLPPRN
jgi:hypothetical protein